MNRHLVIAVASLLVLIGLMVGTWRNSDFWFSADQRGDVLLRTGKFKEAAKTYSDPARIGSAQYRNGEFKEAVSTFARVPGAIGSFNQGNAFLMHGAYDEAIAAYDRALRYRPDWTEAEENKALAIARRNLTHKDADLEHPPDDTDDDASDAMTFDLKGENKNSSPPDLAQEDAVSDEATRAKWLRRVQTNPGDFLRIKFAYQVHDADQPPPPDNSK